MSNQALKVKIFIIEDDFIFTNLLLELIENVKENYETKDVEIVTETFYSVKEAKYELPKKPDIILLDYFLMDDSLEPVTSDKLLEEIQLGDKNIKVVVVSGQEDPEVEYDLQRKGASYYINKSPKSLVKIVPVLQEIIDEIIKKACQKINS